MDNILQHFSRSAMASREGEFSGSDAKRRGTVWSTIWRGARSAMVLNNSKIASLQTKRQNTASMLIELLTLFRQDRPG